MSGLRLSDGRYVLVSNPRPKKRDPLTLSISDDGLVFTRMLYLVGGRHIDYPHVVEHEGSLFIAFAGGKQSVAVLKVRLADVDAVQMPSPEAKLPRIAETFEVDGHKAFFYPILKERYDSGGGAIHVKLVFGEGHKATPAFFECRELLDSVLRLP
jgi:hypothetical protein